MKYFKIFETEQDYTEYLISSDFIAPNVSILRDCSKTWINAERPEPEEKDYFAFVARENATFSFTNPIEYSLDSGETWTVLAANTQSPSIASGDTIMWKKTVASYGTPTGVGTFSATGDFDAEGNAMSLIYGDNFANKDSLEDYPHALQFLFRYNTHIINAEHMELPALFLSPSCYDNMFFQCYNLETAPELPASNLTPYCYRSMFEECASLTTMPSMGMVAVDEGSCQYMFYSATSLTNVIEKLEPLSLAEQCYDSMFQLCTSLTQAPELPATTLAANCYSHMFEDCEELYKSIYLPAETLVSGCYDYMFKGTGVNYVNAMFTTEPGTNYTNNWLANVSEYGTFIVNSSAAWALNYDNYRGESGIPAYTAETEPGVTAYTWNVVGSDYETRWNMVTTATCSAQTTLRYELYEEEYSEDGGTTWHSFNPQVFSAKTLAEKSMHCGFLSGETDDDYDSVFIDTQALSGADLTFVNVEGAPNIKTDASGYVTSFEYTAASDDDPVMFNGNTTIDTDYHAFRTNGTNFKITMRAYCDGNDQVYREGADDNLVNLLTVRGESGGSVTYIDGFSLRMSKSEKTKLVINGNAQGESLGKSLTINDDGTHQWCFKIYYIDGVLKIYDTRNNRYVPTSWGETGKTCNFLLDDGCSAVLACAVKPDGSYYRYCKCKFFEFKLETLEDIYAWNQAPATDFWCEDGNKYYTEYYQISRDGGDTWTNVEPVQTRRGELIERDSFDCNPHYFTIRSLANNNTFTIKNNGTNSSKKFSYSTDDGDNWTDFTLANNATQTIATINSGDTILMKGDNTTLGRDWNAGCFFRGSQDYEIEGNLTSLLYSDGITYEISGGTFHFAQLFSGDTHLISAENLIIRSSTLFTSSFNSTFRGCTNLQKAPDLSIPTVLGGESYSSMFQNCYSLSQPPAVLSATTAQLTTYRRMFFMENGSTAMTTSPLMICNFGTETELTNKCQIFSGNNNLSTVRCFWTNNSGTFNNLTEWMKNVSSTGTFYKRSTQTFQSGANGIPTGWTVIDDDVTGA